MTVVCYQIYFGKTIQDTKEKHRQKAVLIVPKWKT